MANGHMMHIFPFSGATSSAFIKYMVYGLCLGNQSSLKYTEVLHGGNNYHLFHMYISSEQQKAIFGKREQH